MSTPASQMSPAAQRGATAVEKARYVNRQSPTDIQAVRRICLEEIRLARRSIENLATASHALTVRECEDMESHANRLRRLTSSVEDLDAMLSELVQKAKIRASETVALLDSETPSDRKEARREPMYRLYWEEGRSAGFTVAGADTHARNVLNEIAEHGPRWSRG